MARPIRQPSTEHAANVLNRLAKNAASDQFFIDYISKEMGLSESEKADWINERLVHERARWFGKEKP